MQIITNILVLFLIFVVSFGHDCPPQGVCPKCPPYNGTITCAPPTPAPTPPPTCPECPPQITCPPPTPCPTPVPTTTLPFPPFPPPTPCPTCSLVCPITCPPVNTQTPPPQTPQPPTPSPPTPSPQTPPPQTPPPQTPAPTPEPTSCQPACVNLLSLQNYTVVAYTTVISTGSTVIVGGVAVSPGTSVSIPPPSAVIGPIDVNDAQAAQAMSDLTTVLTNLVNVPNQQCCNWNTSPNLGNQQSLLRGAYCFNSTVTVSGTLYLDAQGHSDATFMFFTEEGISTAAGSNIVLLNAGSGCNVYWITGFSATLGASSTFTGNLFAGVDILVGSNAVVRGRLFARTGVVTLNNDMIANTTCTTCPVLQMRLSGSTSEAMTLKSSLILLVEFWLLLLFVLSVY